MADAVFLQIWQNSLSRKANATSGAVQGLLSQLSVDYNARMATTTFTDNILILNTMSLTLPNGGTAKDQKGKKYMIRAGEEPPFGGLRVVKGTVGLLTTPKGERLNVTYIGGGTYGEIWKSNTGRTFKRVIPQAGKSDEELARNFFCEAWIQTILSSDASYGENVSKIIGLYRNSGIVKSDRRVVGDKIFFIEMEFVPYGFESLLDANVLTPDMLRGILLKIAETLDYFERTYQFFHRDFHCGNLMMAESGIKIIDFGMSCCTYNRRTYGMPGGDAVPNKVPRTLGSGGDNCASLDLFLFLMSIRDNFPTGPIASYIDSITQVSVDGGDTSVYGLMLWFTQNYVGAGAATWHSCYYWYYSDFDGIPLKKGSRKPTLLDAILGVDMFKPATAVTALNKQYSVTGIGLSNYIPGLKYTRALFGKSVSPNSNLSSAISQARTLSKGGKSKTRRGKTRRHRKH